MRSLSKVEYLDKNDIPVKEYGVVIPWDHVSWVAEDGKLSIGRDSRW